MTPAAPALSIAPMHGRSERSYVRSTWIKATEGTRHRYGACGPDPGVYDERGRRVPCVRCQERHLLIERLMESQTVLVARVPNTEVIIGWICGTPLRTTAAVHYVYVRNPKGRSMRGFKFGLALARQLGVDMTATIPHTFTCQRFDALTDRFGVKTRRIAPSDIGA